MDGVEYPHGQATGSAERVAGVQDMPQRTPQGSEGETEGGNDSTPRAGGTRSGPGRANREDDKHKPTSRRNDVTRMRTSLIIASIVVLASLVAVSCAP